VVGGSKCNKKTLEEETVSFIHSLSFSFTLIDIFRILPPFSGVDHGQLLFPRRLTVIPPIQAVPQAPKAQSRRKKRRNV
jgi:hypothetical protein